MSRAEAVRALERLWASVHAERDDGVSVGRELRDEELLRSRAAKAAELLRACEERLRPTEADAAARAEVQRRVVRSFLEDIGLGWVASLRERRSPVFALVLVVFAGASVAAPEPWATVLAALGSGVIVACLIIVGLAARRRIEPARWTGAKRRWDERRCTRCSYVLVGHANDLDPSLLAGVESGPRLCPECGLVWPRVPGELL